MKFILTGLLFVSLASVAKEKKHREHAAHSHGHAELSIAFDSLLGQVEFKSPAESIVGFEHKATSEKDLQKLATARMDFETNISKYIQFDSTLGCTFEKKSIEMVTGAGDDLHADFVARFDVTCAKPLNGSTIVFDFTSVKKLKDVDATILAGELQLKTEIRKKKTTLEIKN